MENEITPTIDIPKTDVPAMINPVMPLIEMAIDKGVDVEKLERLMNMKKDWDAEQARIAFGEAMMKFQSKCPIIKKKKTVKNKDGVQLYKFAPIESIVAQTKDLIAENGFSYYIKSDMTSEKVKATVIIKHVGGHAEESSVDLPLLSKTNLMSDAQVVAGTLTFAKRYAFCNAFGIITGDEDNDGIDERLQEKFKEIINHYKGNDYVGKIEQQITTSDTYKQFLDDIPSAEQADKLCKILEKVNVVKHPAIWDTFQKHNKKSVEKFLIDLEVAITKASNNSLGKHCGTIPNN